MLTFTNPSLLPLLALLVPLAIHLWNRRPGREVAVGSLRWLQAGANRRLRNLRLEQWPLLLLRLLLLAGLVGALAGPAWRPRRTLGRGQILVAPALAGSPALAAERPRLDSLRRRGYERRWLAPGLPRISQTASRADSLGMPADSILALDHLANTPDFYAERIRLAADSLAGQPLLALTPATMRGNGGTRRPLPAGVTWRLLPLAAQATWLQAATSTADSLHLLLGQGTERQLTYRLARVARPQPGARLAVAGLPPLRYQAATATQAARLAALGPVPEPAVPVRPAPLRVWVYAPAAQAAEARPLRAALRAAALGLPGPLALTVAPTLPDTAQAPDWLFWLADAPVPARWRGAVRRGLRLWQFPAGAGRADTSHLTQPQLAAPVAVWRRAASPAPGAQPLWRDGLGRPVLTATPLGQGTYYQLATRLLPAWSELAASPDLPALLLEVLHPAFDAAGQQRLAAHDPRRLDPGQVLPAAGATARRPAPAFGPPLDLRPWLVLAGLLLFGLERGLAARTAATPSMVAS
ncbi:hypothetical protein HHL22_12450 [Hymenobacter sp. RP-2-7]|uniref:Aerotolerance regulator N-terminal domain-containing protein n=1 Tax=Hymenobacter polaris TaxID=2682546 RepID=A0A7Y0FN18_9BACT|nr:BatA domain-containing protein [Hymenobacter polaris]NML66015.1 hypothetical protein [Hymenobacter polaris]